jgi:integrase
LLLSQVSTHQIEKVVNKLLDEGRLSNASIIRIKQSMSRPIKEAYRIGLIASNPMERVESFSSQPKKRGILTEQELGTLMTYLKQGVAKGTVKNHIFLACALSVQTGMRAGEICGLHKDHIHLVDDNQGIINVCKAYAAYVGFKTPKGKRDRMVPVPRWLCEALIVNAEMNPNRNGLVFWSKITDLGPISETYLRKYYYEALDKALGMNEEEREARNITFHSFRHYFVTWMRGSGLLSDGQLREVVGHQDSSTTDEYTHQTETTLLRIGSISNNILQFPENVKEVLIRKEA